MEKGEIVEKGNVIDIFSMPKMSITRNFVKTVINDNVPERLVAGILTDQRNYKILRLKFLDSDSTESVLAEVNKRFEVETNILFANISEIQDRILGIIIVQIVGSPEEIKKAESYFDIQRVGHIEVNLKEE